MQNQINGTEVKFVYYAGKIQVKMYVKEFGKFGGKCVGPPG